MPITKSITKSIRSKGFEEINCYSGFRFGGPKVCEGEIQKSIKIKQKSIRIDNVKMAGIAIGTRRVYQCNQQNRRMHERASRKSFRDGCTVVHALEARVNPIEDGTLPRTAATFQSLQHWLYVQVGLLQ